MKGMSILEMMLALFISTFILSSVITIYIEIQSIIQIQQAISTIIENSNMAFYFLRSDLKKIPYDNQVKPFYSLNINGSALTVQHESTHENNTYFIGKTKRKDDKGEPVYALYQVDINKQKRELVEGINDMKIQYTILKNNQLFDVAENEVTNEDKVVGVSITLTFTSLNAFYLQKNEAMYVSL